MSTEHISPSGPPNSGQPQTPAVYIMPARVPGFFRSMLGGIGRLIATIILFMFIIGGVAGMLTMSLDGTTPLASTYRDGTGAARVGIIELASVIDDSAAWNVRTLVDHLVTERPYDAVVFRVDSPGGGVTASDHIWYDIKRLKLAGIKVVASYGGIAASGGYYASCHSDYIFAEPTSSVGSIGVIMQVLTFGDALDKLGIEPVTMVASQSADKDTANDTYREWTDEDRAAVQPMLDHAYNVFFDRVKNGRAHIVPDESTLREAADGSIYTPDQAIANGLVDAVGYLDNAVDHAIQLAGLPVGTSVEWLYLPAERFSLPSLLQRNTHKQGRSMNWTAEEVRTLVHELTRPKVMYLRP